MENLEGLGARAAVKAVASALVAGMLVFGAATLSPAQGEGASTGGGDEPAQVEHHEGSDIATVTLTEKAAERVALTTTEVTRDGGAAVVPYSALMYDAEGGTWVYTSPDHLVFERAAVDVRTIEGDRVLLNSGPETGTAVVDVGAAELWGAEFGVGH